MGFGAVITRGDDFTVVEDIMPWIVEARVEMELSKPAKFALRFEDDLCDGSFEVAEKSDVLRANEMIGIFVDVANELHCLVFGPITRIRNSSMVGGSGTWIEAHGEDRRVIMGREEQLGTWTGRASDAAKAILAGYNIPADVEDTIKVYKDTQHGLSQRATDLAFIEDIARKNVLEFWLDYGRAKKTSGKISCTYMARLKSSPPSGDTPAPVPVLVPDASYVIDVHPPPDRCVKVTRFDARVDFERPNAAKGFSQSAETGKETKPPSKAAPEPITPEWDPVENFGGGITRTAVAPPEATDDEEQGLAARAMLIEAAWFVEVDCSTTIEMIQFCVKPHMIVDVQHAGPRLSGAYQVKSATHVINAADHFIDFKLRANGLGKPKGTP